MWRKLSISNDQFMRTTSENHRAGVRALIEKMFENSPDDFYEKEYEGWYCVGCESFKQDNEIIQGKCILHPTRTLQWVAEKNWFFRLTAYADRLRDLIANTDFLGPKSRRNEMLALLEQGLEDISASRSRFSWGVPFPRPSSDGETQTTYVWFDALPNYLTATGYPEKGYEKRWPADLHVIGKDITRFHAIIWPAMLMSAGLEVPRKVWAHGFVLLAGDRFSKSAGVRLDINEAVDRFGPDAFRYFLLREVPFDADGNFAWERFEERYNADLANAWGNLASRTISMIERYRNGISTMPRAATSLHIIAPSTAHKATCFTNRSRRCGRWFFARMNSSTGRRRGSLQRIPQTTPSSTGLSARSPGTSCDSAFFSRRSCPVNVKTCGKCSVHRDMSVT
jgi:methionyl-tRNA synthetase